MWAQIEFIQKNRILREKMISQWQLEAMAERLMANKTLLSQNRELYRWNQENKNLFPHAKGELHCVHETCEISLAWGKGQHVEWRI